jgi:transcriptional regulator with XRE-family HTH domain
VPDNSEHSLGPAIHRIRGEQKINQEEPAERWGLHRTYYSGIERGVRNVSRVNIREGRQRRPSLTKECDRRGLAEWEED